MPTPKATRAPMTVLKVLHGARPRTVYTPEDGVNYDLMRINFANNPDFDDHNKPPPNLGDRTTASAPPKNAVKPEPASPTLSSSDLFLSNIASSVLRVFVGFENGDEKDRLSFIGEPDTTSADDRASENDPESSSQKTSVLSVIEETATLLAYVKPDSAQAVIKNLGSLKKHCPWPLLPVSGLVYFFFDIVTKGRVYPLHGETDFDYLNSLVTSWSEMKEFKEAVQFLTKFCTHRVDSDEPVSSANILKAIYLLSVTASDDAPTALSVIASLGEFEMQCDAISEHAHKLVSGSLHTFESSFMQDRSQAWRKRLLGQRSPGSGTAGVEVTAHPLAPLVNSAPAFGAQNATQTSSSFDIHQTSGPSHVRAPDAVGPVPLAPSAGPNMPGSYSHSSAFQPAQLGGAERSPTPSAFALVSIQHAESASAFASSNQRGPSQNVQPIRLPTAQVVPVPEDLPYRAKVMKMGHSDETFLWWDIQGQHLLSNVNALRLAEQPRIGDLLSYTTVVDSKMIDKQMFMWRGSRGWEDISLHYLKRAGFALEKKGEYLYHPAYAAPDLRILTWKNVKDKEPTYLKANGMGKKLTTLLEQLSRLPFQDPETVLSL